MADDFWPPGGFRAFPTGSICTHFVWRRLTDPAVVIVQISECGGTSQTGRQCVLCSLGVMVSQQRMDYVQNGRSSGPASGVIEPRSESAHDGCTFRHQLGSSVREAERV